jgi:hypothetical protein
MMKKDELDRPLRRPTTPMTNLNNTVNSQIFNAIGDKKHSFVKNKPNIPISINNTISEQKVNQDINNQPIKDIVEQEKVTEEAFKSREKIVRTPPNINK